MSIIQMISNHHKTLTKHQALKSLSLADHKGTELTKKRTYRFHSAALEVLAIIYT